MKFIRSFGMRRPKFSVKPRRIFIVKIQTQHVRKRKKQTMTWTCPQMTMTVIPAQCCCCLGCKSPKQPQRQQNRQLQGRQVLKESQQLMQLRRGMPSSTTNSSSNRSRAPCMVQVPTHCIQQLQLQVQYAGAAGRPRMLHGRGTTSLGGSSTVLGGTACRAFELDRCQNPSLVTICECAMVQATA
jgi:hypothetical protein